MVTFNNYIKINTMAKFRKFNRWFLYLAIPLILGIVLIILELTNVTHFFHTQKTPVTSGSGSAATKGEPESPPSTSNNPSMPTTQPGDNKSNTSGNQTTTLAAPIGTYASNHQPSLSANQIETSTCTTTPGATCQIIFTNGSTTKSLAAQTTDRGGSTYWNWRPKDLGLTTGTWRIQATASLHGQTQTSSDAINLEVTP